MKAVVLGAGRWGGEMIRAAAGLGLHLPLAVSWSSRRPAAAAAAGRIKRSAARISRSRGNLLSMERAALEAGTGLRYARRIQDPSGLPEADLLLSALWPSLVPAGVLARFPLGGINAHPSLLPKYKGPHPLEEALQAGEKEVGVSLHRMTERYDEGEVLWRKAEPVRPGDTPASLLERMAPYLAEGLKEVLR